MLSTAFFLVFFSRSRWWIDLNGRSSGPFETRGDAQAEAIRRARALSDEGRRSEVQVSAPNERSVIVYQSDDRSLLARAAMLVAS